jgi:hypothetical protein
VIPLGHVGWDIPRSLLDEVQTSMTKYNHQLELFQSVASVKKEAFGTRYPQETMELESEATMEREKQLATSASEVQGLTWRLQLERLKLNDLIIALSSGAESGPDVLRIRSTETEAAKLRERLGEITDRRIRLLQAAYGAHDAHLQDEALHDMWEARRNWEVALSGYTAQLALSVTTNTSWDKSASRFTRPSPDPASSTPPSWRRNSLPLNGGSSRLSPGTNTSSSTPSARRSSSAQPWSKSAVSSFPDTLTSPHSTVSAPGAEAPLSKASSTHPLITSALDSSPATPTYPQIRESLATRMRRNP